MKESSTKLKSQPTGGLHFILIINNFWTTGIMLDVESFNLETFFNCYAFNFLHPL